MALPQRLDGVGPGTFARELRALADRVAESVDLAVPLLGRRHVVTELLVLAMGKTSDLATEEARPRHDERVAQATERYLKRARP